MPDTLSFIICLIVFNNQKVKYLSRKFHYSFRHIFVIGRERRKKNFFFKINLNLPSWSVSLLVANFRIWTITEITSFYWKDVHKYENSCQISELLFFRSNMFRFSYFSSIMTASFLLWSWLALGHFWFCKTNKDNYISKKRRHPTKYFVRIQICNVPLLTSHLLILQFH